MKKLQRMSMVLQMDRIVDPDLHYVSPGGYECNGKCFDFYESEGGRVAGHPDQLEFSLKCFDDSLGEEDKPVYITPRDVSKGFGEFYIYTGEDDEPEIAVLKVLSVDFEFYDQDKDELSTSSASEHVLESINSCIEEQFGKSFSDEEYERDDV